MKKKTRELENKEETYLGREVEAQVLLAHERALLVRLADRGAQREVEHVRARVVVHYRPPAPLVHVQLEHVAHTKRAREALVERLAHVYHKAAAHLHVLHLDLVLLRTTRNH